MPDNSTTSKGQPIHQLMLVLQANLTLMVTSI